MKKLLILVSAILFFTHMDAQNWNQTVKVVASDRSEGDLFGCFVSISGNHALIGAPEADAGGIYGNGAGAAYIFEKDESGNWNQKQKIVAFDSLGQQFGNSVFIDGDVAIVGSYWSSVPDSAGNAIFRAGAAYIFERDETGFWYPSQKITASDRSEEAFFGYAVSINGNDIIVGADYDGEDTVSGNTRPQAGSAYIFERSQNGRWQQVQKLVASDRSAGDRFGIAVDISGDYAIAGAWLEEEDETGGNSLNRSGSAYIFKRNQTGTWEQVQKIVASDRAEDDNFGVGVAIDGNRAVVGAYSKSSDPAGGGPFQNAGAAYLFEKDGNSHWAEVQKITAPDQAKSDNFGLAVAISGNSVLAGSYGKNLILEGDTLWDAGAAYLFERGIDGVWEFTQTFVASDPGTYDLFGTSAALDGEQALVGAYYDEDDQHGENPLNRAGSAYFFKNGTTGTTENTAAVFSAHPNPARDETSVVLDRTYKQLRLRMLNILGQTVFSTTYENTNRLNVQLNGNPGLYFLEIRPDGQTPSILKILKH